LIKGVGLDIVEVSRIKKAVKKWEGRFLHKVFTPREITYCLEERVSYQSLAARFAAKEATVKALGIGFQGVTWQDIEVKNDHSGKPHLHLAGQAEIIAQEQGITKMLLTLSHCDEYAVAQVIIL